ncbi:uncharacterized protein JCM10292_001797 [Rhodotorula paludigena]|uniref:uncharacterized protein n=1 Tax=Rhodotorula paludigena TaxID=86838 RepID=UPI003178E19E
MRKTRSSARLSARPADDPEHLLPAARRGNATSASSARTPSNLGASSSRATRAQRNAPTNTDEAAPLRQLRRKGVAGASGRAGASSGGARAPARGRSTEGEPAHAQSKRIKRSDSSSPALAASPSLSPPPPQHLPLVDHRDPPPKHEQPADRFTHLSSELIALILSHVAAPPPPASADSVARPDLHSLTQLALTSKALLAHARVALYRDLTVETRVQAHAIHRTLHGSEISKSVRSVQANVESMAKTSSQWLGWFLFHSMHSLCGIIGSCRQLLTLTLYLPSDSSAWTQSLCQSFVDLKNLHTLVKDLEPSNDGRGGGAGKHEGMDVGWRSRKSTSMWAVSQFIKPLSTLKGLHTLRLCGISSDSSTLPTPPLHALKLTEVVLIEVNITNTDLMQLLGDARSLQRFTLWRSSLLSKRGLSHVLKKCPNLVEMRIGGSWFGAKEEDDKNFPLNDSLPHLPHLRLLHVSGSLISPLALELPSVSLSHLYVHSSPSWTPQAVHASLSKMPHDPPSVERLTLPEMREPDDANPGSAAAASRRHRRRGGGGGGGGGGAGANAAGWNETWRFTVRKTGEAKGVTVDDRMRPGDRGVLADDSDSDA